MQRIEFEYGPIKTQFEQKQSGFLGDKTKLVEWKAKLVIYKKRSEVKTTKWVS